MLDYTLRPDITHSYRWRRYLVLKCQNIFGIYGVVHKSAIEWYTELIHGVFTGVFLLFANIV